MKRASRHFRVSSNRTISKWDAPKLSQIRLSVFFSFQFQMSKFQVDGIDILLTPGPWLPCPQTSGNLASKQVLHWAKSNRPRNETAVHTGDILFQSPPSPVTLLKWAYLTQVLHCAKTPWPRNRSRPQRQRNADDAQRAKISEKVHKPPLVVNVSILN